MMHIIKADEDDSSSALIFSNCKFQSVYYYRANNSPFTPPLWLIILHSLGHPLLNVLYAFRI